MNLAANAETIRQTRSNRHVLDMPMPYRPKHDRPTAGLKGLVTVAARGAHMLLEDAGTALQFAVTRAPSAGYAVILLQSVHSTVVYAQGQ
jgi:hypothetical protein